MKLVVNILITVLALATVFILINVLFFNTKNLFVSEVKKEVAKVKNYQNGVITKEDIAPLPEPVQKFFRHCGYIGKEKMYNAEIIWGDVDFKMSLEKDWVKLKCYQFNSVPEPCRLAYMTSKVGIIPFEGRDKYQDGIGEIKIKLLKSIRIVDAKSKQMDESALVTVLAETFLVPTYALQDYIKWTPIDSNSAKAEISFNNSTVSGTFFFNDKGEFIGFETDDRYQYVNDTDYKKVKWSCTAGNYKEKNGIRFPSYITGSWHSEEGASDYFKGNINDIRFNVDDISS